MSVDSFTSDFSPPFEVPVDVGVAVLAKVGALAALPAVLLFETWEAGDADPVGLVTTGFGLEVPDATLFDLSVFAVVPPGVAVPWTVGLDGVVLLVPLVLSAAFAGGIVLLAGGKTAAPLVTVGPPAAGVEDARPADPAAGETVPEETDGLTPAPVVSPAGAVPVAEWGALPLVADDGVTDLEGEGVPVVSVLETVGVETELLVPALAAGAVAD